jgi:hypothetical protein
MNKIWKKYISKSPFLMKINLPLDGIMYRNIDTEGEFEE